MKPTAQRKVRAFFKDLHKVMAAQTPDENRALLLELKKRLDARRREVGSTGRSREKGTSTAR